ncbi:MAG: DNA alkylation repair protein [Lachnospiraceae bacterium]|nr:DNA alkylation repair protein [Lachnospiraceae bacterium]
MILDEIQEGLFERQDKKYRDFQAKLIPTIAPDTVIGVRTPALRKYAKQLAKHEEIDVFLNALPHPYFDENQLHAFILSEMKDFALCIAEVENFLSYVDNWATCDQMSPKIFKKHRPQLQESVQKWISSDRTYTIRFAIGMLMEHFLDEDFDPVYLEMVAKVQSEEYYVNMMIAWYFATALAKQYDQAFVYIEEQRLAPWTHNKTIQKAVESYRIRDEQKQLLKTHKIPRTRGRQ